MPLQSKPRNSPAGLKLKAACRKAAKENLKRQRNINTPQPSKDLCEHVGTKSVLAPQIGWHGENAGRYFEICKSCHVKKFLSSIPDEVQQARIDKARLLEAEAREAAKKTRVEIMQNINEQVKEFRQKLKVEAGLALKLGNSAAVPRTPSSPFLAPSTSSLREFTPPTPDSLVKRVLHETSIGKRKRDTEVIDLTGDDSDKERPAKKRHVEFRGSRKHIVNVDDFEVVIIE
ncbi:hypothetical protein M422DRAFT_53753 [Sphaerobolus stellatus SS14]|uniref:Uncharacterized protein n=1 Tax=Sphaerobolus stellatus (strain SS14) TaxID=990650 RepID=A0A0C9UYG5_SPHS4|nr:hypothetical protein M422DRAFT_53753 [Sphaerobolus stellatus SS14]